MMGVEILESSNLVVKVELGGIMYTCRVCMARHSGMINIFNTEKDNIVEEIQFCTGVHMTNEDRLPTNICDPCLNNLTIAYKFKKTCVHSDETLRKLLTENIKREVPRHGEYNGVQVKGEVADENYEQLETDKIVENIHVQSCDDSGRVGVKNELESTPRLEVKPQAKRALDKGMTRKKRGKLKWKKLYCEPCGLKFTTKQLSDKHKKDTHDEVWVCEICGKQFTHRSSHYAHIRSHMPPNHACDQCGYKTWHKSDLIKHIRIHMGIKIYQCEFCSVSYHTSSNLRGHIRRRHEALRPHACPECDCRFFDRTKLNRHLDSHNKIKRFECDVCHSHFSRRTHWKKHLLQQHGVVVPPQRPGRQKVNLIIGEYLMNTTGSLPK